MPYVASIGTYLPCWGNPRRRVAGVDLAEVHDFFTGVDSIRYEGQGVRPTGFGVTILEGPGADGR